MHPHSKGAMLAIHLLKWHDDVTVSCAFFLASGDVDDGKMNYSCTSQ